MQLVYRNKQHFLFRIHLDTLISMETETSLVVQEIGLWSAAEVEYLQTHPMNCSCEVLWKNQDCRQTEKRSLYRMKSDIVSGMV